ncbi:hypothetical protein [Streptomyces sp. NPDC005302]|uniref:hypothetical protein n=1 Tax=Streptomyces sp. NPDC005302 TaxID=3154675 RepID=UPI0033BD58C3
MAWDASAGPYPGYHLHFVIGHEPHLGVDFEMFIRLDQSATGTWNDVMVRDVIEGMVSRGYKLRGAELSKKYFLDQDGQEQTVEIENNLFPMPDHWIFPGWD